MPLGTPLINEINYINKNINNLYSNANSNCKISNRNINYKKINKNLITTKNNISKCVRNISDYNYLF